MVAIGEPELVLLKRIRTELRGRFVPATAEETAQAVKLLQAGYLDEAPTEEEAFVLSDLAEEYLEMLLG